ncbi:MAG TPA: hypothetical protein VLF91_03700 [Candidatus Saccharimonadales bacterium]|nr:hypothetical protein [Candidatus Saccharimonadales bacterium]
MYFVSSDQHVRSQAFDRLISETAVGLSDPLVQLPEGSPDFEAMLAACYLPNITHNQATIPLDVQGETGRIALIPITHEEATTGLEVGQLLDVYDPPEDIDLDMYTEICGRTVTSDEALQKMLSGFDGDNLATQPAARPCTRPFSQSLEALTLTRHRAGLAERQFRLSTPVVQYRAGRLSVYLAIHTAALMTHELRHVADARRWGPFYCTNSGVTATELAGYATTRAVLAGRHPHWGVAKAAQEVANLQRALGAAPDKPHQANPALVKSMKEKGYVI